MYTDREEEESKGEREEGMEGMEEEVCCFEGDSISLPLSLSVFVCMWCAYEREIHTVTTEMLRDRE